MTPERWRQIEELYHAALEHATDERAAFLAQACAGDESLRGEVGALLAANERAGDFLAAPAVQSAARGFAAGQVLRAGQSIGHYRIIGWLGAGGMGEVYLAEDTALGRKAALKLLPQHLSGDAAWARRFEREARVASALNHPNILTIYEIGQTGAGQFIAAEFVEGGTLRQRLAAGRLELAEALAVVQQVAAALKAAHAAGIMHRDIKPENLMIRPDGLVKVLDFGLARLAQAPAPELVEAVATQPGATNETAARLGTPRYMSPEQARGEKLDARTDIFSLGAVFYEMISGAPPFPGATTTEVLAALLNREPAPLSRHLPEPAGQAGPEAASALSRIAAKALAKDRAERYQTIEEFSAALAQLAPTGSATTRQAPAGRRFALAGLLAALLVSALGIGWYWLARAGKTAGPPPRIVPLTSFPGSKDYASFSPDGSQIAFAWTGRRDDAFVGRDIYTKVIGAGEPLQLTVTPDDEAVPVWSPDGRYLAFLRINGAGKGVYLIPARGGAERRLGDGVYTLWWSADGQTLVTCSRPTPDQPNSNLLLLSVETGEQRQLTQTAMPLSDGLAAFSPDGKQIAFLRSFSLSAREVFVIPAVGGTPRQLTFDKRPLYGLTWTGDNREIIYSANLGGGPSLWRVAVNGGTPERMSLGVNPSSPVVSRQGDRLAWTENYADTNIYRYEGPGFTGSGWAGNAAPEKFHAPQRLIFSTRDDHSQQISPDGERIVFMSNRTGSDEVWVCEREGGKLRQLTFFDGPPTGTPRWSPDGRWIVFDSRAEGSSDIYVISAEGGTPRRLTTENSNDSTPSWSRDGRWIYFSSNRGGRNLENIWKMPSAGGTAVQLTFGGAHEGYEAPDGKLFYFSKKDWVRGIWAVPVEGGAENLVPEFSQIGYWRSWGVLPQGVYFITKEDAPRPVIRFYSFATRRSTALAIVEKEPLPFHPGLALAPDGRWLLYAQRDQTVNDLMLMENFR